MGNRNQYILRLTCIIMQNHNKMKDGGKPIILMRLMVGNQNNLIVFIW